MGQAFSEPRFKNLWRQDVPVDHDQGWKASVSRHAMLPSWDFNPQGVGYGRSQFKTGPMVAAPHFGNSQAEFIQERDEWMEVPRRFLRQVNRLGMEPLVGLPPSVTKALIQNPSGVPYTQKFRV